MSCFFKRVGETSIFLIVLWLSCGPASWRIDPPTIISPHATSTIAVTLTTVAATPDRATQPASKKSVSLRMVPSSMALDGRAGVEIEVQSDREFPVRNELVMLRIGAQQFMLSRYSENGDTHTLIFTLTLDEFAKTSSGDLLTVQYGNDPNPAERWDFGPLDKSLLNQKTSNSK